MSEQPKWTPGPWITLRGKMRAWRICLQDFTTLALVYSLGSDKSAEARARLMATAPELYATLSEMREVLQECADDTIGTPTHTFFESKVQACDAVLAKARGETPQTSPDRVGTGVEPPDVK